MSPELERLAQAVSELATQAGCKIVLAESCTAGLVAQSLSCIPGASHWLCGSAVVYRNETKVAWLGVDPVQLADPLIGPVSPETAAAMCAGILERTPEADLAVSVTGHLGPDAPVELDGFVYIAALSRHARFPGELASVRSLQLSALLPDVSPQPTLRQQRQHEAAAHVLLLLSEALLTFSGSAGNSSVETAPAN